MEDVVGEGKDLGKIPKFGEGIGVEDLTPLGEERKGSGGATSESGFEALHSMIPREFEGDGEIRGKANPIQLHRCHSTDPLQRPVHLASP